jgi:hypothetical protein
VATDRILISLGLGCLALAGLGFIAGFASVMPLAAVALVVVGVAALAAGLRLDGGDRSDAPPDGPRVSTGAATIAGAALAAMGCVALVVAVTVAEGEATGHAIGHFAIGIVALGLFAVLGLLWRPRRGTQAALIRGMVVSLLGLAVFGSFLESLGGAGYDATNSEARVQALTALHDIALPFAALGMPGVVLGVVVGTVVLATRVARRHAS